MNKINPENLIKNSKQKLSKCLKLSSKIYDVSFDNFPISSLLSFILTLSAFILSFYHLNEIEPIFTKYNINNKYKNYYIYFLAFITFTHLLSFLHGISISVIETIREWQFRKCKKYCRKYKKLIKTDSFQHNYNYFQITWGILGTIFLFVSYIITVSSLVLSSITIIIVYILKYSCEELSNKLELFRYTSQEYIYKAKYQLENANNITANILSEYQKMVNLQEMFKESSLQKVNEMYTVSNDIEYTPEHNEMYPRMLLQQRFNPEVEIAKGKSYLQILNQTIIYTENNINQYISHGKYYEEVCYDFSGLYDHFYYIFIAFVLLVISSYFVFANHYKYFSLYNYIIKLVDNDIES